MEHCIREYVWFSAEETWQSMSGSARVGAYGSGFHLWVACGNAACRIFMKLIKLFYLFGIEHGLFFRDPANLTDKAKIHLLIHSWVGFLCINIACMCLLGEGICSLGSVLRENSKLTHVLLQASPLSFSVAVTDECHVCSCLPAPNSPAGPLNMCLISGPLQWELWVFAFLLCIPHMPALSIFVVIRVAYSLYQKEDKWSMDPTVKWFLFTRELRKHGFR